jgi:hypothetical protein
VSLQANSGEDGTIKGQVYTGIVVLDDKGCHAKWAKK